MTFSSGLFFVLFGDLSFIEAGELRSETTKAHTSPSACRRVIEAGEVAAAGLQGVVARDSAMHEQGPIAQE